MTAASRPQVVRLRSGDVVRIRQVRPGDVQALARAYARLGEESRYRRFFTARPELSDSFLHAAAEVDHENHEALVALPLLSGEIVGECRFVRLPDRQDTADLAVTVVDAWQGRGLASALLARLSARALEVGIPAPFRRLARVPEAFARIVLLPVIAVRRALLADPEASGSDEAAPGDLPLS